MKFTENRGKLYHPNCMAGFTRLFHLYDNFVQFLLALIKMGDYYWFGCEGRRDVTKSVELYALAAFKGDPQVENQHGSQR